MFLIYALNKKPGCESPLGCGEKLLIAPPEVTSMDEAQTWLLSEHPSWFDESGDTDIDKVTIFETCGYRELDLQGLQNQPAPEKPKYRVYVRIRLAGLDSTQHTPFDDWFEAELWLRGVVERIDEVEDFIPNSRICYNYGVETLHNGGWIECMPWEDEDIDEEKRKRGL